MSKEMDKSFIVEFSAGEVEFKKATQEVWDGFLEHLKSGNRSAGQLQLVNNCCVSLKVNEHTGIHELEKYLENEPAAVSDIADEIEIISGADCEAVTVDRQVKCSGFIFSAPSRSQWDTFQANLADRELVGGTASRMLLTELVDDKEGFRSFIKESPAALARIIMPVTRVAGRGIRIKQKK